MRIILASASPRRIEIMRRHGESPEVIIPDGDESIPFELAACEHTMFLAMKKALCVKRHITDVNTVSPSVIVAADTVVVFRDAIIGKPSDKKQAREILHRLSGNAHQVVTGCALLVTADAPDLPAGRLFYETSTVFFKNYTDAEIEGYLDTPEPYDKAGGYAIQGTFEKYTDRFEGDYENIIGLPFEKIRENLISLYNQLR